MLDADVCEPLARHQQERLGVENDGRPCGDRLVWEYPTDGPVGDCYGKLVACGPRWVPSIVDAEELDERHPDAHRCARLHDPAQIDGSARHRVGEEHQVDRTLRRFGHARDVCWSRERSPCLRLEKGARATAGDLGMPAIEA